MPTEPYFLYTDLVDRFKSLVGVDDLGTEDSKSLKQFVNGRARQAFERFPWPEFTIIGESYNLGTSNTFVIHQATGISPGLFHNADIVYRVQKNSPHIDSIANFDEEYKFTHEVNNVGDYIVKVIKPTGEDSGSVYVTYRRNLSEWCNDFVGVTTGKFGDESGDCGKIPDSLAEYLIHACYVDFLKSDGQASKATQEEITAERLLQSAIDKVQNQGRGYRHDIIQYRPPSQFNRHNRQIGGTPVNAGSATLVNNVQ